MNPFARLELLLGAARMRWLRSATVMVVGLGGVGSSCAEALARGGIGSLILIDGDSIEPSNINRQALAFISTIGKPKTHTMAAMVADINPACTTHTAQVFLTRENLAQIFDSLPRPDYVIDCIDTVAAKIEIAQWCAHHSIHLISSMGAANKLDPSYLRFAKIQKTQNCPLSKSVRRICIERRIRGLEVLYSAEEPAQIFPPASDPSPKRRTKAQTLGSISYMPPIMGQMLAGKVLRRVARIEEWPLPPRIGHAAKESSGAPGVTPHNSHTATQLPADDTP